MDLDKILEAPIEEIEQKDLERFQELGILSGNIDASYASGRNREGCFIKKCTYNEQIFFIFKGFYLNLKSDFINHINLEKYLQSDEFNIALFGCDTANDLKTIKSLNGIKRRVIIANSSLSNIISCKFENEVFLRNINNSSAFSGCEFAKEVYVEGYACFRSCTFNGDFVSKHAREDIDFIDCVFNKSFELATISQLRDINFEGTYFKQKFTMDIREFNGLNFSHTVFDCEFKLQSEQINGEEANFTNATFKQKVSFYRKTINCRIYFEEAYFENELTFTEAKFNDVVNLDKAKFKGKAQFRGTKFNRAILTKTTFENKADFSNAVFNEKSYFTNAIFKTDADFSSATFADEARFFNADFKGTAIFENAEFKAKADFKTDKNLTFGKDANFSNATFHDNAYFNNRVFEDFVDFAYAFFKMKADFMDTLFAKEARFNNIFFYNDACFRNTVFEDIVNFGETIFEKNAIFYNTDFQKYVNFLSCSFKDTLNIINAKIDFVYFTYEDFKELIEDKSKDHRSVKNIDECINAANDFRDSFRLMKHTLNNKGNALDASLFHRLELYCKELQLEFTLENAKNKNSENDKEEVKPKSKNRIELFLDLITLKLYRNTSDHHTNLLQIINFMVLTIAVYGFSLYAYENCILTQLVNYSYKCICLILLLVPLLALLTIYCQTTKYNIVWKNMLVRLAILIFITIAIIYMLDIKYVDYIALFITLYLAIYFIAIITSRCNWIYLIYYSLFIAIFFIKPFLIAPFIGMFTPEQAVESKFKEYTKRYNENGLDYMLLDANLTNTKKDNKLDFIVENRKAILDELDDDKTLFNDFKKTIGCDASSKRTQETTEKPYAKALNALKYDEIMQSTQKSANLLYGFIMLLVIYSLTKTARRNSVVPS
ncbi:pentapeptide repeat-containing protein [Campylobacter showae]|uniref:pentapeptide repeat-containing protein n=1 Tax=Campylobacter showae TaxID=204 RepID=UPI000F07C2C0|nr:pentapeptide repeat-containing protein [Campylobacter showae]